MNDETMSVVLLASVPWAADRMSDWTARRDAVVRALAACDIGGDA